MARPKAGGEKVPAGGRPRRDRASEAEARLRTYHALGLEVIGRLKGGGTVADIRRGLADETGHGQETLRKARAFAAGYPAGQLDELCRLRTPGGMPLAWRLVLRLATLPPGEGREALQRRAAEREWGPEDLAAAIRRSARGGPALPAGGRAFRVPRTRADGLRRLVRQSDEWVCRFGSGAEAGDEWLGRRAGAAGPGGWKARLPEARDALRRVRESAAELERRLERIEAELGAGRPAGPAASGGDGDGARPRHRGRGRSE